MSYLAACFVTMAAVELVLRLPIVSLTRRLRTLLQKAFRVVYSRAISDHWKEKVLPSYAMGLASISLKLGAILSLVGATVFSLSLAFEMLLSLSTPPVELLMTWSGIGLYTVVALAYCLLRSFIVTK